MAKQVVLQLVAPALKDANGKRGINGPEKRALNCAALWQNHNILPVIFYPEDGSLYNEFKAQSGIILEPGALENKLNFSLLNKLRKIIKQHNVSIIHSQGPGSLDAYASFLGLITRKKVVITRPFLISESSFSWLKKALYILIDFISLHAASKVITVTQKAEDYYRSTFKLSKEKCSKIWNGIDLERFTTTSENDISAFKATHHLEATLNLLMVAQFAPLKNHKAFIRIIAKLHKDGLTNTRALFVGDGPLKNELIDYAKELNIRDAIIFTGNLQDVRPALFSSSVCLFPSQREGLSVALLEALCAGLPIVAYDIGGIREQVKHSENGYIAEPFNEDALYHYTKEILTSETLRNKMSTVSSEIAHERFSQATMISSYAKLYTSL
jgi:glycosyltransferase EpsD